VKRQIDMGTGQYNEILNEYSKRRDYIFV
jgi:hypothetical protein